MARALSTARIVDIDLSLSLLRVSVSRGMREIVRDSVTSFDDCLGKWIDDNTLRYYFSLERLNMWNLDGISKEALVDWPSCLNCD
jgi:hypothetical protein